MSGFINKEGEIITDPFKQSEILREQYQSVYSKPDCRYKTGPHFFTGCQECLQEVVHECGEDVWNYPGADRRSQESCSHRSGVKSAELNCNQNSEELNCNKITESEELNCNQNSEELNFNKITESEELNCNQNSEELNCNKITESEELNCNQNSEELNCNKTTESEELNCNQNSQELSCNNQTTVMCLGKVPNCNKH